METQIDLKEEIRRLNIETKFSSVLLEKDYHLTRILHKMSQGRIENLVFKGGTCLNKCYLGFYRLSEDLDFVFNQDVKNFTKPQIKKILDNLRRTIFKMLEELALETNKELGRGWKMLTSKKEPRIVGLEIITGYKSLIDNSIQKIKIEISFRNRLINQTKTRIIHHEFIDALGQPILKEDLQVEVIDLSENFAEKFRALVTRKNIAIRDIYDIYFIIKNNILNISKEITELILIKINESKDEGEDEGEEMFTKEDLIKFIKELEFKLSELNEKEISAVLKSSEKINVKDMIRVIVKNFKENNINNTNNTEEKEAI